MARKRVSPKTDLILQYLAANPSATTREVVAALEAHGISESLVAKVRQKAARKGKRGPKRRRRQKAAGAAPVVAANSVGLNIDDLVAAKKLVAQVGSIERVKEALSALARLG
jgi:hypothetical protein